MCDSAFYGKCMFKLSSASCFSLSCKLPLQSELNSLSYLNRKVWTIFRSTDTVWKVVTSKLSSMSNFGTVISLLVYRKCAKTLVINSVSCGDVVVDFRRNANTRHSHHLRFNKGKIHSYMSLDFCHKQSWINKFELRLYGHIEIQMRAWELQGSFKHLRMKHV